VSFNQVNELAFVGVSVLGMGTALAFAWGQRRKLREAQTRIQAAEANATALANESQRHGVEALHQAEQTQQFASTLIETASILILAVDEQERLRLFNEKAREVTGYFLDDWFSKEWMKVLFPGEDFAPAREALCGMIRGEIT